MGNKENHKATSSSGNSVTLPAPAFPATRPEDVFGCLPHTDKPKTLREMEAGVLAEAARRHNHG